MLRKLASNRNQTRVSASSVQFSSRLAVATSPCWSERRCALSHEAQQAVNCRRVTRRACPSGATDSASLSDRRCKRATWRIDQIVMPPSLHAFGDQVSCLVDLARLLIEQQMIIAKMRTGDMPMKILGLDIECRRSRQAASSEQRQSRRPACLPKSVGVSSRAVRRDATPVAPMLSRPPPCWGLLRIRFAIAVSRLCGELLCVWSRNLRREIAEAYVVIATFPDMPERGFLVASLAGWDVMRPVWPN